MNRDLVLRIESAAELAVPSERTITLGQWRVHLSRGMVRRLNSVALHGERTGEAETRDRLEHLIGLFHAAGLRPRIRQTTLDDWLDDHLDGWAESGETTVMIAEPNATARPRGRSTPENSIEDWVQWVNPRAAHPERLLEAVESARRLTAPNIVVFAHDDRGNRVGAGRAIATDGLVGLFDIQVDEAERRRGYGGLITQELIGWATDRGSQPYLQVEAVNRAALALYQTHGFVELYRYRYRSPVRAPGGGR